MSSSWTYTRASDRIIKQFFPSVSNTFLDQSKSRMAPTPCPHPELYKNPRLLPPAAAAPAQAEWREWVLRDKTTHFYSFLIIIPFYQIFCWMGFRHCQHLRHLPCQQNHVQVLIDPKSLKVFFYFEKLQAATPWDFSSISFQAASLRGFYLKYLPHELFHVIFQGLLNLYRGILPPLLQKSASTALMFGSYEQYRRLLLEQVL